MQLADNMNRLGTETAFDILARAAELQRQGRDVISLGIGQPLPSMVRTSDATACARLRAGAELPAGCLS